MEQYKLINAELMDQVQKQRILIGEMFKTEVRLKKQLLEEHETRLVDAQYNENKLKCAIKTLLQSLDLNLDNSIESCNSIRNSGGNKQSVYSREEACSEMRRSSALLRRSVVASPTRRSPSQNTNSVVSCNSLQREQEETEDSLNETIPTTDKEVKIRKTPEPRRLVDLHANMSSPDTPEAQAEVTVAASLPDQISPPRTNAAALMYSIIEECDSEDNSLPISLDETDTERCSMEYSMLPLNDVTNRTTLHLAIPKACSKSHIESNETENKCGSNIITNRGKSTREPNQEQPSVEHARCAPRQSSPMHLTMIHNSLDLGPSLNSRQSQLNFSAFNGIVNRPDDCSTPQRNEEVVKSKSKASSKPKAKPKPTKSISGSSDIKIEESSRNSSVLGRPSRSCRPKSLKEISCRTKMRKN